METLKVTDNLITEIQNALTKANILIKYKVWEDEEARDLGEPMLLKAPQELRQAMEEMPFYDFGGCAEIVTDNDDEYCIYHLESSEEYFETSTLVDELGMDPTMFKTAPSYDRFEILNEISKWENEISRLVDSDEDETEQILEILNTISTLKSVLEESE